MTALVPPSPIWESATVCASVWVTEGFVEIHLGDGWSGRLLPAEAARLVLELSGAVAVANAWAARWDVYTGTYRDETPSDSSLSLGGPSVGVYAPALPPVGVCGPAPVSQHGPGAGHPTSGGGL
jgi:hypothetical protein